MANWWRMEPKLKLLCLIKYTDLQGVDRTFHFITECQNKCHDLGLELDIDAASLNGLKSSHGNPTDFCKAVLQTWIDRGHATWEKLLQTLYDIGLGGIAKNLEEVLRVHYS